MNRMMTESYIAPVTEVVEVCVELGYGNSLEDPTTKDEQEW